MQVEGSLQKWRLARNYKQDYLAQKLGISQQSYHKLEAGKTKLKIEVAERLALVLDVPIDHIYTSAVLTPPAAPELVTMLYERLLKEKDKHLADMRELLHLVLTEKEKTIRKIK